MRRYGYEGNLGAAFVRAHNDAKTLLREVERLRAKLAEVHALLLDAPELNMSNYTEDDVTALNHAVNEACCMLEENVKAADKVRESEVSDD